ncbi:ATP-binding protein, partial [Elusimicrobiota bacterium]
LLKKYLFFPTIKKELKIEEGTGLGLYSCKKIIEKHKGRIKVDSIEGMWAEFRVYIPEDLNRR